MRLKLLFALVLVLAIGIAHAGPGDPLTQQTPCQACWDGCYTNYESCHNTGLFGPKQCGQVRIACETSCDANAC